MIRKIVVGIAAIFAVFAFTAALRAASAPAPAKSPAIATVASNPITRAALEQRAAEGIAEYQRRLGRAPSADLKVVIQRQALESLIRSRLLALEAKRKGVTVSLAEAEAQLKTEPFFQDNGRVVEERFRKAKEANSPEYQETIRRIREDLSARKLYQQVVQAANPEEARVRAIATRALTRASFDYLSLRFTDFTGDEVEPREADVIAYHRAHAAEFQRPARATLTVLHVQPAGNESDAAVRARADSVVAAVRDGARFETASEGRGVLRKGVVVLPGNFPGYWKSSPKLEADIFRSPAGKLWPTPLSARPGWVVFQVESARPAGPATLAESSLEIRQRLRTEGRARWEEENLRAAYEAERASLATTAYKLRYAIADTSEFDPGEPTSADLDRYYRSHQADYTRFDAATASLQTTPFTEVRDDVRARWRVDRRAIAGRAFAQELAAAWGANRRDRKLERGVTIRENGPVPSGAMLGTDAAAVTLSDSLAHRGMSKGVQVFPYAGGNLVVHVYEEIPNYIPTFEQALPSLRVERAQAKQMADEEAARVAYEKNPGQITPEKVVFFTRMIVEPPNPISVDLTRAEVERWFQQHMDRYSAPEMVTARHILISPKKPGSEGDAEALRVAEDLERRIRAGEDFGELARRYSDDPATRDKDGDLGPFGRGVMLDKFETAAFAMKPGDVSPPVRTEVGYHIIKVTDHVPLSTEPLARIYVNVGGDAAIDKADRIAHARADSLLATLKTVAQAKAAARKMNLDLEHFTHPIGKTDYPDDVRESILRLETFPVGKIVPTVYHQTGIGEIIEWSDSVGPAPVRSWEQVRGRMLEEYRRGAGRRAFTAKRAELDSLESAGWSLDSLAALWGGMHSANNLAYHQGLPDLGGETVIDSLAFGGLRPAALSPGETTGWVEFPLGFSRLRLRELKAPAAAEFAARAERERKLVVDRYLYDYFLDLKTRYPVRILDETMREAPAPPMPEPTPL